MIKWGIVGLGDISNKRVVPAIRQQKDSLLVAAHSPFEAELDAFAERHGIPEKYLSLQEMLSNREIDAVYVATPIFLHYGIALEALRAGKHVLVEKPMAMTNAECEALIAEAKQQNVKLGVAYFRRFFPKIALAKQLLEKGAIGAALSARITFHSWYNPAPEDPKYWRVIKSKGGGGPLWDMGCHKLDLLQALLGDVKSVQALLETRTHGYEVEDTCAALLEMECGAYCQASFHWNSRVWADEFELLGSEGKLRMTPGDGDSLELELPPSRIRGLGKELTVVSKPNAANVHAPLVDDFARAVLENREPLVNGETGYRTNRLLAAIEEASASGRRIYL